MVPLRTEPNKVYEKKLISNLYIIIETNFGLMDLIYGVFIRSLNDLSFPYYVLVSQNMNIELIESFDQAYPEELHVSVDCLAFANACAFNSWGTLFADGCC